MPINRKNNVPKKKKSYKDKRPKSAIDTEVPHDTLETPRAKPKLSDVSVFSQYKQEGQKHNQQSKNACAAVKKM